MSAGHVAVANLLQRADAGLPQVHRAGGKRLVQRILRLPGAHDDQGTASNSRTSPA